MEGDGEGGRWTVDGGRWTVDSGQWTMGGGAVSSGKGIARGRTMGSTRPAAMVPAGGVPQRRSLACLGQTGPSFINTGESGHELREMRHELPQIPSRDRPRPATPPDGQYKGHISYVDEFMEVT